MVDPIVHKYHQPRVELDGSHSTDELHGNRVYDIQLRNVSKVFDEDAAVQGVNLNVKQGEFFSILGPSGCGKTTILRLIAGFETPTTGDVVICGQMMTHTPAYRRPVNTVFQSYALFDHMTVWDNIAFGLKIQRLPRAGIRQRVQEALRLVKMEEFAARYPMQLSGGQQQRVALARALVNRPAVVLLDEPLGALDLKLRKEMQVELANLHHDLGITFIMVTHDQEEALSLSDRIAVMRDGQIEQVDVPQAIYDRPQTAFVADFIGDANLFHGIVVQRHDGTLEVVTSQGLKITVRSPDDWVSDRPKQEIVVSVRPENIHLGLTKPGDRVNCFEGRLNTIMYLGTHVHYVVELQTGDRLKIMQPGSSADKFELNAPVYVHWHEHDCLAFPTESH